MSWGKNLCTPQYSPLSSFRLITSNKLALSFQLRTQLLSVNGNFYYYSLPVGRSMSILQRCSLIKPHCFTDKSYTKALPSMYLTEWFCCENTGRHVVAWMKTAGKWKSSRDEPSRVRSFYKKPFHRSVHRHKKWRKFQTFYHFETIKYLNKWENFKQKCTCCFRNYPKFSGFGRAYAGRRPKLIIVVHFAHLSVILLGIRWVEQLFTSVSGLVK